MKYLLQFAIIAWFLFSISIPGTCQLNWVPNSSFEVYDTCPSNFAQLRYCPPWNTPLNTTPDYNNSCDTGFQTGFIAGVPSNFHGFQYARSGNGYAGIATYSHNLSNPTNYREYLQAPLLDSMISGVEYFLRFYVSPGDSCRYVSNTIGVYFSNIAIDTLIFPSTPLPYIPQFVNPISNSLYDKNVWTAVSGTFVATGGEKFIIIGNFNNYLNTDVYYTGWGSSATKSFAYYYIDDVFVAPLDSVTGINSDITNSTYDPTIFINNNNIEINSIETINSVKNFNYLGQLIYTRNNINSLQFQENSMCLIKGINLVQISLINKKVYNYKIFKS